MENNIKKAFTLAEVVIVIGIIGVIAELTIPDLVKNISDMQYKVAWKKEFSAFSQATMQMSSDNGGTLEGLFADTKDMRNKYAQYMIKAKICDDSIAELCRVENVKELSGKPAAFGTGPSIILNDGAVVQFWLSNGNCQQPVGSRPTNTPVIFYRCGGAAVDINGLKKPNVFGKDIFDFHILKDRILPYGTQGDFSDEDCSPTGSGEACSATYLYN